MGSHSVHWLNVPVLCNICCVYWLIILLYFHCASLTKSNERNIKNILHNSLESRKDNRSCAHYRCYCSTRSSRYEENDDSVFTCNKQNKIVKERIKLYLDALVQPFLQWKSNKYYIYWVCDCSLRYPARHAHASYCRLWPARLYYIFHIIS